MGKEFEKECIIGGFPGARLLKSLPASAGDVDLIPRSQRSPGEGSGNPLQYSCLGNPVDNGAWWSIVHEVTKSLIQLSN